MRLIYKTPSSLLISFFHQIMHFLYPSFCLHCEDKILSWRGILCDQCAKMLTRKKPNLRSSLRKKKTNGKNKILFDSVFENIGPSIRLLNAWQRGSFPALEKALASYLFIHSRSLKMPQIDYVVPMDARSSGIARQYRKLSKGKKFYKLLQLGSGERGNFLVIFDIIKEEEELQKWAENFNENRANKIVFLGLVISGDRT